MIDFFCPTHGFVVGAPAASRVECRCGKECAPEGVDPKTHVQRYLAAHRGSRSRSSEPGNAVTRAFAKPNRRRARFGSARYDRA